jgi:hypothetical protein
MGKCEASALLKVADSGMPVVTTAQLVVLSYKEASPELRSRGRIEFTVGTADATTIAVCANGFSAGSPGGSMIRVLVTH